MAILNFSLTPEATAKVFELLVCLAKFGESVAIEARNDKVSFQTSRPISAFSSDTKKYIDLSAAYIHRSQLVKDCVRVFRVGCKLLLPQL